VDAVSDKKDKMKFEFYVKWGLRGQARSCLQVQPITELHITSSATLENNTPIHWKELRRTTKGNIKRGIYCVLS